MRILTKLPEDIPTSQHLNEKVEGWISVMHLGITYYVPVTKEFKKAFQLKLEKDILICKIKKQESSIEPFLRDLIGSLYLQIRDTVGDNIHQQLSEEITENLEKLFSKQLENRINMEFDKKQLEYKNDS